MRSIIILFVLVIVVLILVLIGITDINPLVADTGILDSNVANNQTEANKSVPPSATLTITMTTVSNP